MSWLREVIRRQKTHINHVFTHSLMDRKISRKEHAFLIAKITQQLALNAEVLYFFGCLDAAQHIDDAIEELEEFFKVTSANAKEKKNDNGDTDTEESQGAEIFNLHEERPA